MSRAADSAPVATWRLNARVVAVGLPGIAGVRQIGRFHFGGPIPGNPEFLLQTDQGRVLDPQRLMVAVASNFGAAAVPGVGLPGSILSIDPRGDRTLVIAPRFARDTARQTLRCMSIDDRHWYQDRRWQSQATHQTAF